MLDLLILHPGAAHGIYGALGDSLVAVEPPLWCRLIAGHVRDRGHSVAIIDAEAERLGPREIAARVRALAPRLLCIAVYGHQPSASTQQMHGAGAAALAIREECDHDFKVVMMGGHVSALPDRTLREEAIDYACAGEGPVTIEALLRGVAPKDVPGLAWRRSADEIVLNPRAPLIADFDRDLHGDAWDLLPMALYRSHNWQAFGDLAARQPYASVYTSLGCPYRCSFCCINAPFGRPGYRMRSPAAVVAEITMLHRKYGVRTVKIVDELFVLNDRHVRDICEGLIGAGIAGELNIWAYARTDTIRPGQLELLRRAGVRWLALGIESGNEAVRDGAEKRLKSDDIVGAVRRVQEAGINVIGNYIFGLPDDDLGTMRQTLDLALELNCEFANFYVAMAYPGSPLHAEALAAGAALPASWRGYSQHNDDCRPLDTRHVSGAAVLRFRDAAFQAYFTAPRYRAMVAAKFGAATLAHVEEMTRYTLKRRLLEGDDA